VCSLAVHLNSFSPCSKPQRQHYLLLPAALVWALPCSVSLQQASASKRSWRHAAKDVSAGQRREQAVCQELGESSSVHTKPITGLLSCERAGLRPWSTALLSDPLGERLYDTGAFVVRSAESWAEITQLWVSENKASFPVTPSSYLKPQKTRDRRRGFSPLFCNRESYRASQESNMEHPAGGRQMGQEEMRSPWSKDVLSFKVILSPERGCVGLMSPQG